MATYKCKKPYMYGTGRRKSSVQHITFIHDRRNITIQYFIQHLFIHRFEKTGIDHFERKIIRLCFGNDSVHIAAISNYTNFDTVIASPSSPGADFRCRCVCNIIRNITSRITNTERMSLRKG